MNIKENRPCLSSQGRYPDQTGGDRQDSEYRSSNKIEGIYTSDERLKKLVQDKTTPRTRNEQEIAGYRDVLATIHESFDYIPPKASMILQLHRDLYKFSGASYGGHYKTADNVIAETDAREIKAFVFNPFRPGKRRRRWTASVGPTRRLWGRVTWIRCY